MSRYKPDLTNLLSLAETNYMLLNRLLTPIEQQGQSRLFFIDDHLSYRLTVLEDTRYTHVVKFEQLRSDSEHTIGKVFLPRPVMVIRLYHDAKVIEVIESQCVRQIKPRYNYPNKNMHQPDEKHQTLAFLGQWLQLCLQQGRAPVQLNL
ncbi:DUF1249 domain-containing protein [Thalassotalea maritima]|uniref:DUF1249 domain-containing protein n=1 Tax=Thalassotalea maritima TaxID=3242416 RepID=UPI00352772E0